MHLYRWRPRRGLNRLGSGLNRELLGVARHPGGGGRLRRGRYRGLLRIGGYLDWGRGEFLWVWNWLALYGWVYLRVVVLGHGSSLES